MELSTEFIEQNKLTPEQAAAVKTYGETYTSEKHKEWDGKANADAEGILEGVVKSVQTKFGINEPRQQGEKYAAYVERISAKTFEAKATELANLKADYEQKVKDFKGGDALKSEVDAAKKLYDDLQKQTADYADVKKKADQFDDLSTKYSSLKVGTAFRDVKPNFPDTVNSFERDAKWKAFEDSVLKDYDVEIVDGKPMAISKENKHRIVTLESLVKENKEISELLAGRQQVGTGARQASGNNLTIEGVPFPVPENCDSIERRRLIMEYLTKEGMNTTSDAYSAKFAELNKKILNRGK